MSRLNLHKPSKAQDIFSMNNDEKYQKQKRSEKARQLRSHQFDQNRNIATKSLESFKSEPTKELLEWRKKKELEKKEFEKKKQATKKPFLPSGPNPDRNAYKPKSEIVYAMKTNKSTHHNLTTNSDSKNSSLDSSKSPRSSSNPTTSIPSGRVTRSQVKREKERAEHASSLQPSKQVYVVEEKDLAWIPEHELDSLNLKIRRKSLHFSDVFSDVPRSPFVFKANDPEATRQDKLRVPPIIENSIDISPISVQGSINRNLLGAFTLLAEDDHDTQILGLDGEVENGSVLGMQNEEEPVKEIENLTESLVVAPAPIVEVSEDNQVDSELDSNVSETGIDKYTTLMNDTSLDLISQRDRWQATLHTLTEACDSIRVAIGHTDLLLNKKFKQYSGLIEDARDNPGNLDLETRCSDLQGFWDLIQREVEDMQAKYSKLIRLAENGYQAAKSTHKLDRKPIRRQATKPKREPTVVPRVTRSSTASSSLREQIMRGREQLKERTQEPSVIIMTQQKNE